MHSCLLPPTPPVCSSGDDDDDVAFDDAIQFWKQTDEFYARKQLAALKQDDIWLDKHDKLSEDQGARIAARQREIEQQEEGNQSADDAVWNENRALNLQDFEYHFRHREHFPAVIRTWLEIVASKISHIREDGEDGYFKKLEQNIGWTDYITPIMFSGASLTDSLVRCGIWAHAKNSRRCHHTDFCPYCLWNDKLKVLVHAFGQRSGAFNRAPAWWFITIGWTTNPKNAKCLSGDFNPEACKPPPAGDGGYDPYPVRLGRADNDSDEAWPGYDDAHILGLVMQEAINELYQHKHVDGYHNRLEGSYKTLPGLTLGPPKSSNVPQSRLHYGAGSGSL